MIKLVIFDGYGVIITGGYTDTALKLSKKFGVSKEKIYAVMYTKHFNAAAERKITQKEAWDKTVKDLNFTITGEKLKQIHYSTFGLNKKIFPLVKKLSEQGVGTLLLSKNTRSQFHDANSMFPELKKIFGKNIINTWELKLPKASKQTIDYICKKYQVKPNEIIYIDDQEQNLLVARKMGVKVILYTNFSQMKKIINNFLIK